MANIPLDENLAAILVAAQYVVGYCLSSMFVTRYSKIYIFDEALYFSCSESQGDLCYLGHWP